MRIERGQEILIKRPKGRPMKYPWKDMAVGDILVVAPGDFYGTPLTSVRIAAHGWARLNGVRMQTWFEEDQLKVQRVE